MKVSISQSAYLPWLGYFDRIFKSDIHIILDHVSKDNSSKTNYTNRNKIRTPQDWMWLSVPLVKDKQNPEQPLNEVRILDENSWKRKHLNSIKHNYGKARFYNTHKDFIHDLFEKNFQFLHELNAFSTEYLMNFLQIKTKLLKSSEMSPETKKSELILELCEKAGAKTYISGPFGRNYLDKQAFLDKGIDIEYHDYVHPIYSQVYKGFEPYMSTLDLVLNEGDNSREIIINKQ